MKLYFLFALLVSNVALGEAISEQNLQELVARNPGIRSYTERLKGAEEMKGRLTRSFLPKLTLSYGQEKFTTGPYYNATQPYGGINAEVNLFNSGRDSILSEKINREAEIALIESDMARIQVLAELRRTLSHYAYLSEVRQILKTALEQNETNLEKARKRVNGGLGSNTDLLDFKQQKVQLGQELATLEFELGVASRMISTLLGIDPKESIEINFANAHPDHADEKGFAITGKSRLVKRAELEQGLASLELKRTERWWTPSVDLYAYALRFTQKEREYNPSEARNDVTLGFKFTFPIFDGGEGLRTAAATKALARARSAEVTAKNLEIERISQDAIKRLELAHNLIHGSEENVQIMNDYRQGILSEYARGIKNSPDVLQASQRWIEAKSRYAEVKKNYHFARVDAIYLVEMQSGQ